MEINTVLPHTFCGHYSLLWPQLCLSVQGGVDTKSCWGYVLSDFSIGFYAYLKDRSLTFGYFEAMIATLTVMCLIMYVWSERRERFRPAVIMSAIAAIVAGIPQIFYSFAHPFSTSVTVCALYIIVSMLSYYGDKPTFEARLIPGLSVVYWLVIVVGVFYYRMV